MTFTPHLILMNRDLSTHGTLTREITLAEAVDLTAAYDAEPFVRVLDEGVVPGPHVTA